ncbi:hypothetical protein Calhy_0350 [Caldicellulosiruptor hydrothermalis 108]|uniref:Uncharacterized protein n=2 Tax=Caldicellulosiruptor TaxID=44000 RepID=E4QBJ6_CALH1|nr:hypothetical protein Calhy_0350 [Caldicellulosiruptor hydrothermalis 108]
MSKYLVCSAVMLLGIVICLFCSYYTISFLARVDQMFPDDQEILELTGKIRHRMLSDMILCFIAFIIFAVLILIGIINFIIGIVLLAAFMWGIMNIIDSTIICYKVKSKHFKQVHERKNFR